MLTTDSIADEARKHLEREPCKRSVYAGSIPEPIAHFVLQKNALFKESYNKNGIIKIDLLIIHFLKRCIYF